MLLRGRHDDMRRAGFKLRVVVPLPQQNRRLVHCRDGGPARKPERVMTVTWPVKTILPPPVRELSGV